MLCEVVYVHSQSCQCKTQTYSMEKAYAKENGVHGAAATVFVEVCVVIIRSTIIAVSLAGTV